MLFMRTRWSPASWCCSRSATPISSSAGRSSRRSICGRMTCSSTRRSGGAGTRAGALVLGGGYRGSEPQSITGRRVERERPVELPSTGRADELVEDPGRPVLEQLEAVVVAQLADRVGGAREVDPPLVEERLEGLGQLLVADGRRQEDEARVVPEKGRVADVVGMVDVGGAEHLLESSGRLHGVARTGLRTVQDRDLRRPAPLPGGHHAPSGPGLGRSVMASRTPAMGSGTPG